MFHIIYGRFKFVTCWLELFVSLRDLQLGYFEYLQKLSLVFDEIPLIGPLFSPDDR